MQISNFSSNPEKVTRQGTPYYTLSIQPVLNNYKTIFLNKYLSRARAWGHRQGAIDKCILYFLAAFGH